MERQAVQSRALAAVGYDADAQELELEFRTGRVYRYSQVPASVHEWLLRVPNKGLFISRHISGHYPERSLPDRARPGAGVEASLEQMLGASLEALGRGDRE